MFASLQDTPPGSVTLAMAGLLTCGSSLSRTFPGACPVVFVGGRSPLTVAGAVTDLAPFGCTSPCSHFISPTQRSLRTINRSERFPREIVNDLSCQFECRILNLSSHSCDVQHRSNWALSSRSMDCKRMAAFCEKRQLLRF